MMNWFSLPETSVTIFYHFVKISIVFGKILMVIQLVGQNFDPTLENCFCYWANFRCCKWPNIEQIIQPSGCTASNVVITFPYYRRGFLNIFGEERSTKRQWLWLSWQGIYFLYQRSAVRIQLLVIFKLTCMLNVD